MQHSGLTIEAALFPNWQSLDQELELGCVSRSKGPGVGALGCEQFNEHQGSHKQAADQCDDWAAHGPVVQSFQDLLGNVVPPNV